MSKLDTFLEKTGDQLETLPEFQAFIKAKKALEKDKQAQDILRDVEDRKQTKLIMEAQNLPISAKQETALQAAFTAMRANEVCMEYLRASNVAAKTARTICNYFSAVTGVPFTSGGGCCS